MRVHEAQALAREWITRNRDSIPGYIGSYLTGSICWQAATETLPATSDVDLMVIVETGSEPDRKPGKQAWRGILLEITITPFAAIADPEVVLPQATIASSIARNSLLDDPHGMLGPIFATIAREFPRERRVIDRLDHLQSSIIARTTHLDESAPFHRQVLWIFPATLATALPIVAALGNPTVRKRFVESRRTLDAYDLSINHEQVLGIIGATHINPTAARNALHDLVPVYDRAATTSSRSPWTADIAPDARAISIDGTRELIETGYHREAMFWIVATWARALDVLALADTLQTFTIEQEGFRHLTDSLGIGSLEALRERTSYLHAVLPEIRAAADAILARNPAIIRP